MSLNENYIIKTATELTQEAIRNNLFFKNEDETKTAKAIASFFKTLTEELKSV